MARRRIRSLAARFPRRLDVPLLLGASLILLLSALCTPLLETRTLLFWRDEHSIIANVADLHNDRKIAAALILASCSVGYPLLKIGALWFLWIVPFSAVWRSRFVGLLRLLGRWSMVDVVAVAAIVLGSQAIGPMDARPLPGLYLFAAAILVLSVVTMLMDRLARRRR